ncbi:MAG: hypothetical protein AAFY20_25860 [Cyanobacteria bacterium J06639_14]
MISATCFQDNFGYLAQMRSWRIDPDNQARMYQHVRTLSSDREFELLCKTLAASDLPLKPGDLIKELKLNQRSLAQNQPAPAPPSGDRFGPCNEQIRFFKYLHLMRQIAQSDVRGDRAERRKRAAHRLAWKWPLSEGDHDRWSNASPQKAISSVGRTL